MSTTSLAPRRAAIEASIVLALTLGKSAVYSVLSLADKLTRSAPLNQQVTSINASVTPDRPWLDLAYQVAQIGFGLVPVLLVWYLLGHSGDRDALQLNLRRPAFDVGVGILGAAAIGIPGLALYLAARAVGLNTTVSAANLAANWWTVPVLIGLAIMNGLLEEVVMIGYVVTRLRQAGMAAWAVIVTSALVRGTYHLYQGWGGFVGNIAMGLVFGLFFLRYRRVGPLIVAHTTIDMVAFVGYPLVAPWIASL